MLVGLEGGNAMDLSSSLDGSKERDIVKACTEFYESHLLREPSGEVFENRPSPEALALSTLYLMREGIPSLLQQNDFLMVQLPELSRLKCYGCKVSTYTHARRFTQVMLYDERLAKR